MEINQYLLSFSKLEQRKEFKKSVEIEARRVYLFIKAYNSQGQLTQFTRFSISSAKQMQAHYRGFAPPFSWTLPTGVVDPLLLLE